MTALRPAFRCLLAAMLMMVATGGVSIAAQGSPLQPGQRLDGELARNAAHTYTISLPAGRSVHVVIEAPRSNILERARRSDGFLLDNLGGLSLQTWGRPDRIVLIAEQDVDYAIELRSIDGVAGAYTITASEPRTLTDSERHRFEAQRLLSVAGSDRNLAQSDRRALAERSRSMFRDIDDPVGEADALLALGYSFWLPNRTLARPYFQAAVDVAERAGDLHTEREALNAVGESMMAMGEPRQAAALFHRALDISHRLDAALDNALLIQNLAYAYRDAGDYQRALRYGREVLALWGALGGAAEAYASNNVGTIYLRLGDTDRALELFTVALERFRSQNHTEGMAKTSFSLGTLQASRGDHRAALDHLREAIRLWRGIDDADDEAAATARLGVSLAAIGDAASAAEAHRRALALARRTSARLIETEVLRHLGELAMAGGRHEEAAALLDESVRIAGGREDRPGEAATRLALARLAGSTGRLEAARAHIERALELIESLRTAVASPDFRASFTATKRDYYDFYIDLLMQLHRLQPAAGHDAAALMASERGRARSLVELLTEAGADIRQAAPSALLERERVLQNDVTSAAARLTQALDAPHASAEADQARRRLQAAMSAYESLQEQLREQNPRYAALMRPPPIDLRAIQDRLLDDRTTLVEYALGAERSYAFVVSRKGLSTFELPARAVIETAARETYDALTASRQRQGWGPAARAAARLSELVLAPLARELGGHRVLIVPDGALHYIPFAALPRPGSAAPLVVSHEIVSLPSASALDAIRREWRSRKPAGRVAAVLADPVLDADDGRVRGRERAARGPVPDEHADVLRSAAATGLGRLERLVFSRVEADALAEVVGRQHVLHAVDFNASRATALSAALADYRIVHFATHGLMNSAQPELSGLVLSLVDRDGRPQDGFLRLHDIYNMKLGAELVVLSACRTALGRDIRGEGLLGLTRGFMYAGAPRVVASLWDVRDRATAELMRRFYAHLLREGLSAPAALRAAQVSMLKEARWQSPFNWAGFVIQGDWQ